MTPTMLIFVITFLDCVAIGNSASYASVTSLYDHLTTYNYSYVRPESDLTSATTVSFTFFLTNLQDLDEAGGKFSVAGFFEIYWKDNNMTWDPSSYDGANNILIPSSRMWKPHLVIGNPYKSDVVISLKDSVIRVYEDGAAHWHPADSFEIACDSDVSFFPFDSQTCKMMVLPWQYGTTEIIIKPTQSTVNTLYYNTNPMWDYVKSNVYNTSNPNALYVSMTFKRKPTFFMVNIILPILLLGILNIFVFVLPADSGERVGFAVTLLLAVAVFMTIISDSLPSTSSPRLSSVGIFLCVDLTLSALMTLSTLFGLLVYHRDEQVPISKFWLKFMRLRKLCFCCNKRNKIVNDPTIGDQKGAELQNAKDKKYLQDNKNDNVLWKDVGKFLDKFFIVFFSFALFIANLAFFMDIVLGVN